MAVYDNTNYHQDAINAAQKGDWDAVNRALGARDAKVMATGQNYGQTSDQIYQNLWNEYGAPTSVENGDMSAYLKQMYANQTAAELASLKSTYEQNIAQVDANVPKINAQYQAARNETAAQSEIDKRNFAEYAAANSLNSGTGGQAELARQVSLTGNLAGISEQEKNALAENELMKQQLTIAYNNAIAEANAKGDAALAQSLYNEYVRQIEYNNQQQAADREYAANLTYAMLQAGIVPDAGTLAAAGISATDANALAGYYKQQATPQATKSYTGDTKKVVKQEEEAPKTPVTQNESGQYPHVSNNNYGSKYNTVWGQVRRMKDAGKSEKEIIAYLERWTTDELTDAGYNYIATSINLGGYRDK